MESHGVEDEEVTTVSTAEDDAGEAEKNLFDRIEHLDCPSSFLRCARISFQSAIAGKKEGTHPTPESFERIDALLVLVLVLAELLIPAW